MKITTFWNRESIVFSCPWCGRHSLLIFIFHTSLVQHLIYTSAKIRMFLCAAITLFYRQSSPLLFSCFLPYSREMQIILIVRETAQSPVCTMCGTGNLLRGESCCVGMGSGPSRCQNSWLDG